MKPDFKNTDLMLNDYIMNSVEADNEVIDDFVIDPDNEDDVFQISISDKMDTFESLCFLVINQNLSDEVLKKLW